jgi:cysteinyl-tRNA synthetase
MVDDDDWYSDYDPTVYNDQGSDQSYGNSFKKNRRGGDRERSSEASHDYTRDTSRDTSNVDEDAVNHLLVERVRAKKRRDFDLADEIRDQLLSEFAVGVYDRELTWRTGCSSSGSGMKRGGGNRNGSSGRERGGRRRDREFGPNGHDYDKSFDAGPNASSLSEERIHSMIAERLQAKLNRNFDVADRLQYELVEAGVFVHDAMKQWRADGIPFGDFEGRGGKPGMTKGSWSDRNRPYQKSDYSVDIEGAEDQIAELVEARSKCKASRDYMGADRIRDDLRDDFDVHIDDRLREWSVGGNFGDQHNAQRAISQSMKTRGYVKLESSPDLSSPADEEYVQTKIDERQEAKKMRDYDTADSIRDELLADFDITINDKLRKWSVGGDFGDELQKRPGEYTRRGGGKLTEEDVATIKSMVVERAQAKKNRNFDVADEIRDHLRDTYQVTIDDKSREWRIDSDEYVQSPVGQAARELSEDEIAIVQAKLVERWQMKRDRDYEAADAIRDELLDNFSVLVDDRTKEWKTVEIDDAEFGDKFAEDAMMSQKSDFKRKQIDVELDDALTAIFESNPEEDSDGSIALEVVEDDEFPDVTDTDEDAEDSIAIEVMNDELPDAAAIASPLSRDDLMALKIVDLKEKLREAGKPVSGIKAELVERLLA